MKKFNISLFLKASFMLIIFFIGAFLLCSCVGSTSAANAEETGTVQKFVPLSGRETEPSVTLSSSETVSTTIESAFSSVTETVLTTTTARATEQFATTSSRATTAAPSSSAQSSSSDGDSSRPGLSGRIDRVISKINDRGRETEVAEPVEVTVPSSASSSSEKLDFTDCAFLGNSRVLSVKNYGFCKDVYGKVSLNVETVFTEKSEGSSVPIIDELKGKKYKKIFIMFGDNETGWESMDTFKKDYIKVINAVRERVPGATIYLISVLPISKEASDRNDYGYNKNSIDNCNRIIQDIAAQEGLTYVNAAPAIADSKGYLPPEASTDGCHLGKEYTRKWLEVCAKYV